MTRSGATARHIEVCISGGREVWTQPQVSDTFAQALALAPRQLIIDLTWCSGIDAAGIELLLATHRQTLAAGGLVTLKNPSERVMRNLKLAMLDRVLHVSRIPRSARRSRIVQRRSRP